MADQPKAEAPKKKYRPWGHMQWAPQWLRTFLLGQPKPFHRIKERAIWRSKTEDEKNNARKEWPGEIIDREKTLATTRSLGQAGIAGEAVLFGGLIFSLTLKPSGAGSILALIWATLISISLILLFRANMNPPHTLFTTYSDPYQASEPRPEEKDEGADEDERDMLKLLERLRHLNTLAQFTKRCVGWAAVLACLSLPLFIAFLCVTIF